MRERREKNKKPRKGRVPPHRAGLASGQCVETFHGSALGPSRNSLTLISLHPQVPPTPSIFSLPSFSSETSLAEETRQMLHTSQFQLETWHRSSFLQEPRSRPRPSEHRRILTGTLRYLFRHFQPSQSSEWRKLKGSRGKVSRITQGMTSSMVRKLNLS